MKVYLLRITKILFILFFVLLFSRVNFTRAQEDEGLDYFFPLTTSRTAVSFTAPSGFSEKKLQSSLNDFEPGDSYILLENDFNRSVISIDTRGKSSTEGVGTGAMCYESEKNIYSTLNPVIIETPNKSIHLLYWDKNIFYHDGFFSDGYRCIKVISKEDYSSEFTTEFTAYIREELSDYDVLVSEDILNIFIENIKNEYNIYIKSMIDNRQNSFPFAFEIVDYYGRGLQEIHDLAQEAYSDDEYEVRKKLFGHMIEIDNIYSMLTPEARAFAVAQFSEIYSYNRDIDNDENILNMAKKMFWSEIRKYPNVSMNYENLAATYARLGNKKQTLLNLHKALRLGNYKLGYGMPWGILDYKYYNDPEYQNFLKTYLPYRLIDDSHDGPFIGLNYKGEYIHLDRDTLEPLYEEGFTYVMPFYGDFARVNGKPGQVKMKGNNRLSSGWYLINKKGEIVESVDK